MTRMIVRADASRTTGVGHVMRTLAIAEAAVDRGLPVEYATRTYLGATLVRARGFDATVVADEGWLSDLAPGASVVLDGYDIPDAVAVRARELGCRVGRIDDLARGAHHADVVLNPSTDLVDYDLPTGAALLTGPEHALIRREFHTHRTQHETRPAVTSVLVSLGGADVLGLSEPITRAIARLLPDVGLTVVAGPATDVPDGLPAAILRSPREMAPHLVSADLVVAAAGGTAWELAYLGVPAIYLATAANQTAVLDTIERRGIGLAVRTPDAVAGVSEAVLEAREVSVRQRLSERGRAVVDGGGVDRFLEALIGE